MLITGPSHENEGWQSGLHRDMVSLQVKVSYWSPDVQTSESLLHTEYQSFEILSSCSILRATMKILVTVGTTAFDSLIRTIDQLAGISDGTEFFAQISSGDYVPENLSWERYVPGLLDAYKDHLVITHCGAGTVFTLLDSGRKFIAVPNLERKDQHQLELAEFLHESELCAVAFDLQQLSEIITEKTYAHIDAKTYKKDDFFKANEIKNYLLSGVS